MSDLLNDFLHSFHFLRPLWLLALPLLLSLAFWLAKRQQQTQDWSRLIDPQLMPLLRLEAAGKMGGRPWAWLALAWSLSAIALSGPCWQRIQSAAYRAPADWIVVLDLSPSMASSDLSPNRIIRARYALEDILASARDARVGLVAFGEEAFTVSPLTDDVATVKALLPPLVPDIMPSAGDHLAPALDQAAKLLSNGGAKDRRIILLTDGFDDPAAAMASASALKSSGIALSVVGVGTAGGAPLRNADGHFSQDAQGRAQLARLDVDRLHQLASVGGGHYVDLAQVSDLLTGFQASGKPAEGEISAQGIEVASWQDAGVWILPLVLILAAFISRRGWL